MGMVIPVLLAAVFLAGAQNAAAKEAGVKERVAGETVVLIHGMGGTRSTMWMLKWRLEKAGYTALNFPYGVRTQTLDEISANLHQYLRDHVKTERYHLVGHSLGNIIIRNGAKTPYPPGLGRIVMLAPPNHPNRIAKRLHKNPLYRLLNGNSGQCLASPAFYQDLPAPPAEFGIVAADAGSHLIYKEPNDGLVSIQDTKLEGAADWTAVPHTHTFMLNTKDTARLTIAFLREGCFGHSDSAEPATDADPERNP